MPACRDTLVAVYEYYYEPVVPDPFNPSNPSEPGYTNAFCLYLTTNVSGACSFNRTSGAKVEADTYVSLTATTSQNYTFDGWYRNGIKIADTKTFSFLMPAESTTLQAVVSYNEPVVLPFNPTNPDEPGYTSFIWPGDVNEDGVVNVMDATMLIGAYLNNTTDQLNMSVADVNQDGIINVMDATEIISIYLNNK